MVAPKKTSASAFGTVLRRNVPVDLLNTLATQLGWAVTGTNSAVLSKCIADAMPLEHAAAIIRRMPVLPRLVARAAFGRMEEELARIPTAVDALLACRSVGLPEMAGGDGAAPHDDVPCLRGSVVWSGEIVRLSQTPQVLLRSRTAQAQAAEVHKMAEAILTYGGDMRVYRTAVDKLGRALEKSTRLPTFHDPQAWVQLLWNVARDFGVKLDWRDASSKVAIGRLVALSPAELLEHMFGAWRNGTTQERILGYDVFGDAAWRLLSACDPLVPEGVHRVLSLAALETLPVDKWVPVATFIDHLNKVEGLPVVALAIRRAFSDPRIVPVSNVRPDHNEGEPFRLRVPCLLKAMLDVPARLGLLDVALAAPEESVLKFSGPRANVAVCQAPYRNLTHIRRTLLGADWLDPFQGAGPPEAGPGPGGLDALAALLS